MDNKKIPGICIVIGALLISAAIVFSATRPYDRYKVVGARVFDTRVGKYVSNDSIAYASKPQTPQKPNKPTPPPSKSVADIIKEQPKSDFSKVVIAGKTESRNYDHVVMFTVKNNDTVRHEVKCKIIYYDKNKQPILTDEKLLGTIKPDDIVSEKFIQSTNYESINSYELKLEETGFKLLP